MLELMWGFISNFFGTYFQGTGLTILDRISRHIKGGGASKKKDFKYAYEAEYILVEIEIENIDASRGAYRNTVHAKCTQDTISSVNNMINFEGQSKILRYEGILGPAKFDRMHGPGKVVTYDLTQPVSKGELFKYYIEYELVNSFPEMTEFWEEQQTKPCKIFVLRVVFNKYRPPKFFKGYHTLGKTGSNGTKTIAKQQPLLTNTLGRPTIEWIITDIEIDIYYRIEWSW